VVREWLADLAAYIWRMAHRWLAVAVTIASFILIVLSDIRHRSIGLPIWGWGLVAMGGIVIAGFLEWRTLFHRPEHVAKIRKVAESVHDSLHNGRSRHPIAYSDGVRDDEFLKEMFQGHCPGNVASLLDEWDQVGLDIPKVESENIARIQAEVTDQIRSAFTPEDGWYTSTIVQQATAQLERRLRGNTAGAQIRVGSDAIVWNTTVIKDDVDTLTDETRAEANAQARSLSELVNRVEETWPKDQLRTMAQRRGEIAKEVYHPLQLIIHDGPIRGRCPICKP
jgi:hypothetical protein